MAVDWGDQPPELSRALARRVFSYFAPYWRPALVVLACIGASAALGLAPALVTKGLIDYLGNPTQGLGPLALLVAAGVAASLAGGLVGVLQSYLETRISQGIMFDLRAQLFDRLLGQSVGFFTHSRSGDLLSRMNNDVGGIADVGSDTGFGFVSNLITLCTTLALVPHAQPDVHDTRAGAAAAVRGLPGGDGPDHRRYGRERGHHPGRPPGGVGRLPWQPVRQYHRLAGAVRPHLSDPGP